MRLHIAVIALCLVALPWQTEADGEPSATAAITDTSTPPVLASHDPIQDTPSPSTQHIETSTDSTPTVTAIAPSPTSSTNEPTTIAPIATSSPAAPITNSTNVPTTSSPAAPTTIAPSPTGSPAAATTITPSFTSSAETPTTITPTFTSSADAPTTTTNSTSSITPSTSIAPSPTSSTAAPTSIAPSPTSSTAAPTSIAPSPTSSTAAPTSIAPSPTSSTAAPTSIAPSPTSSTAAPTSIAPSPTSSTTPTPTPTMTSSPPKPHVRISETNILLVETDKLDTLFVELQGNPKEDVSGVWLVIMNAQNKSLDPLLEMNLNTSLNDDGILVVNKTNKGGMEWTTTLEGVEAVLIALSLDVSLSTENVLDVLIYSSDGNVDEGLHEDYGDYVPIDFIISHQSLKIDNISVSRCSDENTNAAFMITIVSQGQGNNCSFSTTQDLEMQLVRPVDKCPEALQNDFNNSLVDIIITGVNKRQKCGFSLPMLKGMKIKPDCSGKTQEVNIQFTAGATFQKQMSLVIEGYESYVNSGKLTIDTTEYDIKNCTRGSCSPKGPAPTDSDDDNRIRVTVAVVVSCICVFLVVLLFVVLYMRRKRRGILQFRMTRLDEYDDDLMGDMDDFVGNQGPTFRNYR